ncbi:DUF3082 domain-containing protein [Cyanobium sp. Morenito 9A2]|uniref:DUF3082 domain-containing protein n=1 Tax=Cyanobium sp. Morenito 9A2 TaxID=2823718 RepID=UPI0020CE4234|nr:DUF3082 domain-containing protein [Cyanobium sp. Morenito 9A2]MCP9850495.1 DUF3082 domain-containing protein [Cyanobium sp. Morenito 9A2]
MAEISSPKPEGPLGSPGDTPPPVAPAGAAGTPVRRRKGPLSFLSGSITSFALGWLALQLSYRLLGYYADHPPHYDARFAQSIATFMKTLILGMSFLAIFTFAFVGLGLLVTFFRSLMPGWQPEEPAAPATD